MIVVDSSVWISKLRDMRTEAVLRLEKIEKPSEILVGDAILLEVLQGARSEAHAAIIERSLRRFRIVTMMNPRLAVRAAANYRLLRERGFTIRGPLDMIIGTFCIQYDHVLLHQDRDFDIMEEHLGLRVL